MFDAALDLEADERAEFVERTCEGDAELRLAVERLLRAHDRAGAFLAGPAAAFAAPLLDGSGPADAVELLPHPERVGPYRIDRELGRGGMGVVYLAERDDPQFRQRVALKVVQSSVFDTRSLVPRFLAERQILASLEHPHIARLFDGGITPEGLPYYTMAYYEGGTLAERLAGGRPLPLDEALRIARQLAAALGAAHTLGIVHRDVKPANVLFDAAGEVRLSDFGVAKLLGGEPAHSGAVPGTAAYLAPEQVQGTPVDHRADLWALGVTLYEMLAGRRPFRGPSYAAVLHDIVTTQPEPVARHAPGLPVEVDTLLLQLLEKSPAARPQSAEVVLCALDSVPAAPPRGPPPGGIRRPAARPGRRRTWLAAGAGLFLVAALAGDAVWQRRGTSYDTPGPRATAVAVPTAEARPSLAVLPFANTSGDPADEHFSDGLTDELIGALSKVADLRVAGRTSTFAIKGRSLSIRTIADTLGVGFVVEGSVRRVGDRLKVGVQLVGAGDGTVVWTETYDRELRDVFAVQEEIAQAIVGALRVELAGARGATPGGRPNTDPTTYELYLKGRFVWRTRSTRDGILLAARLFEQAIARDSTYAPAYAGLSDAHARLGVFGYGQPHEEFRRAKAAARRALALDSALAEAHTSLAHTLFVYDFDHDAAEREFRRAIALDPGYSTARYLFAICLQDQGRFDEALAQLDTARAADPLSALVSGVLGRVYVNAGRPDPAIRHLRDALELNPQYDLAYQQLGHAYLQKGMASEAVAALRRAAALSGARDSAQLAYAYAVTGQRAEALKVVRRLVDSSQWRDVPSFHIAMAYAGLGDIDEAFRWLFVGYEERSSMMDGVKVTAAFVPLHSDPRWPRLLRRMGHEP